MDGQQNDALAQLPQHVRTKVIKTTEAITDCKKLHAQSKRAKLAFVLKLCEDFVAKNGTNATEEDFNGLLENIENVKEQAQHENRAITNKYQSNWRKRKKALEEEAKNHVRVAKEKIDAETCLDHFGKQEFKSAIDFRFATYDYKTHDDFKRHINEIVGDAKEGLSPPDPQAVGIECDFLDSRLNQSTLSSRVREHYKSQIASLRDEGGCFVSKERAIQHAQILRYKIEEAAQRLQEQDMQRLSVGERNQSTMHGSVPNAQPTPHRYLDDNRSAPASGDLTAITSEDWKVAFGGNPSEFGVEFSEKDLDELSKSVSKRRKEEMDTEERIWEAEREDINTAAEEVRSDLKALANKKVSDHKENNMELRQKNAAAAEKECKAMFLRQVIKTDTRNKSLRTPSAATPSTNGNQSVWASPGSIDRVPPPSTNANSSFSAEAGPAIGFHSPSGVTTPQQLPLHQPNVDSSVSASSSVAHAHPLSSRSMSSSRQQLFGRSHLPTPRNSVARRSQGRSRPSMDQIREGSSESPHLHKNKIAVGSQPSAVPSDQSKGRSISEATVAVEKPAATHPGERAEKLSHSPAHGSSSSSPRSSQTAFRASSHTTNSSTDDDNDDSFESVTKLSMRTASTRAEDDDKTAEDGNDDDDERRESFDHRSSSASESSASDAIRVSNEEDAENEDDKDRSNEDGCIENNSTSAVDSSSPPNANNNVVDNTNGGESGDDNHASSAERIIAAFKKVVENFKKDGVGIEMSGSEFAENHWNKADGKSNLSKDWWKDRLAFKPLKEHAKEEAGAYLTGKLSSKSCAEALIHKLSKEE